MSWWFEGVKEGRSGGIEIGDTCPNGLQLLKNMENGSKDEMVNNAISGYIREMGHSSLGTSALSLTPTFIK